MVDPTGALYLNKDEYASMIKMKGTAVDMRNIDKRLSESLFDKTERNAINVIIHYHDTHSDAIPQWAVNKMNAALVKYQKQIAMNV